VWLSGGAQQWGASQLSVGTRRLLATGATGHGGAFLILFLFNLSWGGQVLTSSPPPSASQLAVCARATGHAREGAPEERRHGPAGYPPAVTTWHAVH